MSKFFFLQVSFVELEEMECIKSQDINAIWVDCNTSVSYVGLKKAHTMYWMKVKNFVIQARSYEIFQKDRYSIIII